MNNNLRKFFNRQSDEYHSGNMGMRSYHEVTARILESNLEGSILCIGGLWNCADTSSGNYQLTVLDVSEEMLSIYSDTSVRIVQGEARELPFAENSFDHVVLPLVLHHITDSSAGQSPRKNVSKVLLEASKVLKKNGKIWVYEFCLSEPIYHLELALQPLTRYALSIAGIPLVVMHSAGFYYEALRQAGLSEVTMANIQTKQAKATDWIQPIIGFKFLKIPRFLYPIQTILISAHS